MEINSILLTLAVIVLTGMYLYTPFMNRARRATADESHEVSALQAERDRMINALQELDFDHNLGKVPAEDYPAQRAALLQKGADILRKLDELAPSPSSGAKAEARIEKAAASRRADSKTSAQKLDDDDLEAMIAARRKQHNGKSAGFCPKCGKPILSADKFCPSCGKALK